MSYSSLESLDIIQQVRMEEFLSREMPGSELSIGKVTQMTDGWRWRTTETGRLASEKIHLVHSTVFRNYSLFDKDMAARLGQASFQTSKQ